MHQEALLKAIAERDLKGAPKHLKSCKDISWPGLDGLYQHFEAQVKALG